MGLIFAQCGQEALQCHGVVGVVDHQREVVAYLHHLDAASDMDLEKCFLHLFRRDAEMPADRDRAQRVVDAETSGRGHFRVEVHESLHIEGDAQLAGLLDQLQVFRVQVGFGTESVSLYAAGVAVHDPLVILVVRVEDTHSALPEQKALALQIVVEILVLVGADMIRGEICEDSQIEQKSLRSVQHQSLGGNFHDYGLHAGVRHILEGLLKDRGFGRRVVGLDLHIAIQDLNGADQADFEAGRLQDGLDHIGGSRLSLGSGHADDLHAGSGIAVIGGSDVGHGVSGVLHPYDDGILNGRLSFQVGQIQVLLYHQRGRTVQKHLPRELMPVPDGSLDAEEEAVFRHLSRVVDDLTDLGAAQSADLLVVHDGLTRQSIEMIIQFTDQFCDFHSLSPSYESCSLL